MDEGLKVRAKILKQNIGMNFHNSMSINYLKVDQLDFTRI